MASGEQNQSLVLSPSDADVERVRALGIGHREGYLDALETERGDGMPIGVGLPGNAGLRRGMHSGK